MNWNYFLSILSFFLTSNHTKRKQSWCLSNILPTRNKEIRLTNTEKSNVEIVTTTALSRKIPIKAFWTTSKLKETWNYLFTKTEEHHSVKNELLRNKDDQGWRRLTRITNDKLEKVKLNFSRFANCNEVPLIKVHLTPTFFWSWDETSQKQFPYFLSIW